MSLNKARVKLDYVARTVDIVASLQAQLQHCRHAAIDHAALTDTLRARSAVRSV